uniref:Wsv014 n=1 Tax=White spot syndrome virus TaxID=92652 RepID=A0A2U9G607_WSSV|nr:wsv014 [Shrimp white spot syndrome virus]
MELFSRESTHPPGVCTNLLRRYSNIKTPHSRNLAGEDLLIAQTFCTLILSYKLKVLRKGGKVNPPY